MRRKGKGVMRIRIRGCSERHYVLIGRGRGTQFTALNFSKLYPLVLLVTVGCI
jgi:hypothetical protein